MGLFLPAPSQPRPAVASLTTEDIAWHALYRSAHDPSRAAEVVEYLDIDEASRKTHLALYLVCRQTMRAHDLRQIRIRQTAAFLRLAGRMLFVMPILQLARLLHAIRDLGMELMPDAGAVVPTAARPKAEPAAKRVRRLVKQAEFAEVRKSVSASQAASSDASAPPADVVDGVGAEAFAKVGAKAA